MREQQKVQALTELSSFGVSNRDIQQIQKHIKNQQIDPTFVPLAFKIKYSKHLTMQDKTLLITNIVKYINASSSLTRYKENAKQLKIFEQEAASAEGFREKGLGGLDGLSKQQVTNVKKVWNQQSYAELNALMSKATS